MSAIKGTLFLSNLVLSKLLSIFKHLKTIAQPLDCWSFTPEAGSSAFYKEASLDIMSTSLLHMDHSAVSSVFQPLFGELYSRLPSALFFHANLPFRSIPYISSHGGIGSSRIDEVTFNIHKLHIQKQVLKAFKLWCAMLNDHTGPKILSSNMNFLQRAFRDFNAAKISAPNKLKLPCDCFQSLR